MSKLFKYPKFSPLPPSTNAADVIENIQHWIDKGKENNLKFYCRPDNSNIGYRFVEENDFLETIEEEQIILKRKVKITFTRYAEVKSRAWYPLHFTIRCIDVQIFYKGKSHKYKNDNQLRLFFRNN